MHRGGWLAHSLQTLLKDLATIIQNQVRMGEQSFQMLTAPAPAAAAHL